MGFGFNVEDMYMKINMFGLRANKTKMREEIKPKVINSIDVISGSAVSGLF